VQSVAPGNGSPRKPAIADYLSCPNCTTELEDYDDRQRRLECPSCHLRLTTEDQLELMEKKEWHGAPRESDDLDL
jgi:hypothetical protein